jgi:hypothetical protein
MAAPPDIAMGVATMLAESGPGGNGGEKVGSPQSHKEHEENESWAKTEKCQAK